MFTSGKVTGTRGFTLVEILIVIAVIGLISAVAFPQFIKARTTAGKNICISNLKKIGESKEIWAVWEGGGSADTPSWSDLVPDYLKKTPVCPLGGTYSINRVDTDPTCTIEGHEITS
ncbi:MAG: prepilin-type N-terminal cleavage/methylation domain-containing protein [Candidatus Omnitrophica bacterium]|nr:prepilin-type N-terminal cleavage/methylation domain-containing protein [Candidatus Omnitrophota bacterium]